MNENIYYELMLFLNKRMYENSYISHYSYQKAETNILTKMAK